MNGNDVCDRAIESAGDVQRLASDLGHKKRLRIRLRVKMLFDYVTSADHLLDIFIRHTSCSHSLLCVQGDDIAIFSDSPAQLRDVELPVRRHGPHVTKRLSDCSVMSPCSSLMLSRDRSGDGYCTGILTVLLHLKAINRTSARPDEAFSGMMAFS